VIPGDCHILGGVWCVREAILRQVTWIEDVNDAQAANTVGDVGVVPDTTSA
jgi:hypothetical protein